MTKIVHKFIDLVKKIGDRGSLVIAISISVVFDMRFCKLCEFNEVVSRDSPQLVPFNL